MNKIAAMLNMGPKNANLAPGTQNAMFGRGAKDANTTPAPPGEQNLPPPPGLQPAPMNAMNHHGSPPNMPPGFPPNMPGNCTRYYCHCYSFIPAISLHPIDPLASPGALINWTVFFCVQACIMKSFTDLDTAFDNKNTNICKKNPKQINCTF